MSLFVNGIHIHEERVNLESAHYREGDILERQHRAAVGLVIRQLLLQRAAELGLASRAEGANIPASERTRQEDVAIETVLEHEVQVPSVDEAVCLRYFEQNRERFHTPVEVRLRHILLAVPPDDLEGRAGFRDLADRLIERLRTGAETFADLAAEYSDCPSAGQGGRLGWVGKGSTVPELEAEVLRQNVGLAERPVETRWGFHVVEVLERGGGESLPYITVRDCIAEYLEEQTRRRATRQYIQRLVSEATVFGVDMEGAESPLMQ